MPGRGRSSRCNARTCGAVWLGDFFAALHYSTRDRDYARLDQWWGPARCADLSGGKTSPDAHGRWRHGTATVPFWVYSDTVRQRTRALITTLERHHAAHTPTAEHDDCLRQALAIARKTGNQHSQIVALNNLGEAYLRLGRFGAALPCAQQALART
jgi:hypothetical protein